MKRLSALMGLVLALCVTSARAQNPDDQYVRIYNLIQQGDTLNNSRQPAEALAKYLEAQGALQKIQKLNPEWSPKVVNYRLSYLADKIAGISSKVPAPTPAPAGVISPAATPTAPTNAPALVPATVVSDLERQMTSFQNELSRLQADKMVLEAKLKEALATQPATIDPRELTKAQEKAQSLLKENELLKTSLANEQSKPAPVADTKVLDETKRALADANRRLVEQTERANTLATEKSALQKRTEELAASAINPAELATAKSALAEANRKLAAQTEAAGKLAAQNTTLQSRVTTLAASAEAADALRTENQMLKKQLADVKAGAATTVASDDTARRLTQAEARIASLQSDAEILRLEKLALENRVRQANAATKTVAAPPVSRDADLQRIKQLERERDDFQKKLAAATKELDSRKGKEAAAKVDELSQEISTLRTRLEVFQARAIPYTPEELALFKQPASPPVNILDPNAGKKSTKNLPAGTTALAAEAQRHFSAKEFDKAEEKYLEILRQDDKNVYTLANLAAIDLELNRLDEAEKNVKAALAGSPDDGYSLSILGYLRFRQEKYDEAVDALGRAAKFNPQSAEIQNYLGVALSHQGQRGPAETALRTAIQLDPAYGSAHNNLAVIYLTQQPPLVELARWHYQKALTTGHPRNPELEKMIEQKAPAGTAP